MTTPPVEENEQFQFVEAVGNGDLETVKNYVKARGIDINFLIANDIGKEQTPLMMASRKGKVEIARYLVKRGAELNKVNKKGVTVSRRAGCRQGQNHQQWC